MRKTLEKPSHMRKGQTRDLGDRRQDAGLPQGDCYWETFTWGWPSAAGTTWPWCSLHGDIHLPPETSSAGFQVAQVGGPGHWQRQTPLESSLSLAQRCLGQRGLGALLPCRSSIPDFSVRCQKQTKSLRCFWGAGLQIALNENLCSKENEHLRVKNKFSQTPQGKNPLWEAAETTDQTFQMLELSKYKITFIWLRK